MPSAFLASIIARFTFAPRLRNGFSKTFRCSALTGLLLLVFSYGGLAAAQLTVRWDDNSSRELGFKIERSTNGSTFTAIAILGANTTSYVDSSVASSTTYWYRVRAYDLFRFSSYSNVTSGTTAASTSTTTSTGGRIKAFQARAVTDYGAQSLILHFSVVGGTKSIVLRGIGPGLIPFTSSKTLPDPVLKLYSGTTLLATNDNWGGTATLISAFKQVGAFAIAGYSKDSAMLRSLAANTYTSVVNGEYSGLAQTELYDADTAITPTGRLTKAAVRAKVGTGSGVLIGGFVIAGNSPVQVLVRAIGPSLTGVTGSLQNPQLSVHQGTTLRGQNDNWGGTATLAAAFNKAGAPPLPGWSKDSALLLTLSPGTYSATVSGVSSTTGIGRLEVYTLP